MLRLYIQILMRAWESLPLFLAYQRSRTASPPDQRELLNRCPIYCPWAGSCPFGVIAETHELKKKQLISGAAVWNAACFMHVRHDWNVTAVDSRL